MSGETTRMDLDPLEDRGAGGNDIVPAATVDRPTSRCGRDGRAGSQDAVSEIPVQLSAVLEKATMPVSQLLRLGRGAVVELDRRVGESIDILVNNRLGARGEVVVVDDRLGMTMTEIIKSEG